MNDNYEIYSKIVDNIATFDINCQVDIVQNCYLTIILKDDNTNVIEEITINNNDNKIITYHEDIISAFKTIKKGNTIIINPDFFWNHCDIPMMKYTIKIKFKQLVESVTMRVFGKLLPGKEQHELMLAQYKINIPYFMTTEYVTPDNFCIHKITMNRIKLLEYITGIVIVVKKDSQCYDSIKRIRVIYGHILVNNYKKEEMLTILQEFYNVNLPENYYYLPISIKYRNDLSELAVEIVFGNVEEGTVVNAHVIGSRAFYVYNKVDEFEYNTKTMIPQRDY